MYFAKKSNIKIGKHEIWQKMLKRVYKFWALCYYVQTQKHLIAVDSLKTPEEVINYDYTTGYPEKIVLE